MLTKKLTQGSKEWHEHRANSWNASELPAVVAAKGSSKTRQELLKEKSSGLTAEVTDFQQRLFDEGHRVEAAARVILERELDDELYPVTGVSKEFPKLSASFDGLTIDGTIAFEHKMFNKETVALIQAGTLPEYHKPQVDQLFKVCPTLERVYFVCSDGTEENRAVLRVERPDDKALDYIVPAWELFEKDLAAFVPVEVEVLTSNASFDNLPYLSIEVQGGVIASNLTEFRERALEIIGSVNTDLRDDQDFADAEKAVKWCESVETKLEAQKTAILSQTADIATVLDTLSMLKEETRQVRLSLSKAVKEKKESRKYEIVREAQAAFAELIKEQEQKLGTVKLMPVLPDFAAATKGKRTIGSLIEAVEGELAKAKLAAIMKADRMAANIAAVPADMAFLFTDLQTVADKAADDFQRLVASRIDAYKQEQARREQEKAEAEARLAAEKTAAKPQAGSAQVAPAPTAAASVATENSFSVNAQIRLLVASHFGISEAEADKLLCAYTSTQF